jgi:hypothetical protein
MGDRIRSGRLGPSPTDPTKREAGPKAGFSREERLLLLLARMWRADLSGPPPLVGSPG